MFQFATKHGWTLVNFDMEKFGSSVDFEQNPNLQHALDPINYKFMYFDTHTTYKNLQQFKLMNKNHAKSVYFSRRHKSGIEIGNLDLFEGFEDSPWSHCLDFIFKRDGKKSANLADTTVRPSSNWWIDHWDVISVKTVSFSFTHF